MRPERVWRGVLTIAATYVAFLLFAQFGFLSQAQSDLGDAGRVKAVMAAMGLAGLAASLGTAWLLGRVKGARLIRAGLGAVAAVAAGSVLCHSFPALMAAAAGIGASMGLLTVAVAASLREIVPPRLAGRAAGLGTGAAYLVSNIPALFEAAPAARALFPAALALVALLLFREAGGAGDEEEREGSPGFARLLVTFLVLIWLDSAAFAIVQASPELKAQTWGSAAQKLIQGSVHFAAAAGAGFLLDAGFGLLVPLTAWALFALAFPLLQHGGLAASIAAGPLYAVGISFYSAALVVTPARGSSPSPRWRAGLLYGVAGWIGSALGVGMAQDLGRIPGWFLGVTGAVLALAWLPRLDLRKAARLFGPALAIGALGVLGLRGEPQRNQEDLVALGRRVYIQEGCIHCHSQYVRPGTRDEDWWGPSRPLDRGERPPLLGVRRQGPDLLAVGNRRSARWQEAHLRDPRALNPGSRMPSYARLFDGDGGRGKALVAYLTSLGAETGGERGELTWEEPLPPAPRPASRERGAKIFAAWCAACHGGTAQGNGPLAGALGGSYTNLRRSGFHALTVGRGAEEPEKLALARIVRHGLPGTSMPGHEWLGDQQVADLVAYVRTLPQ